jgi:TonB family protein
MARISGIVIVECQVAEDGAVSAVEIKSGHPVLGKAALENAKTWRFKRSGSVDEPSTVQLTFEFRLEGLCTTQCCNQKLLFRYPDRILVTAPSMLVQPTLSK